MLALVLLSLVQSAQAAGGDSMALFKPKADEVLVMVTEKGGERLKDIFTALAPGRTTLSWRSEKADANFTCRYAAVPDPDYEVFTCTFKFNASDNIQVDGKNMSAKFGEERPDSAARFDLVFSNPQDEFFHVKMTSTSFSAEAAKR